MMAQNHFNAIRQAYEAGDLERTRLLIQQALDENPTPQLYRLAAEVAVNQGQKDFYLAQAAQLEAAPDSGGTQPTQAAPPPEMTCPTCGTPNLAGNTLCVRCGFSLQGEDPSATTPTPQTPPPTKNSRIHPGWIVAGLIILCLSLWAVVLVFAGRRIFTRNERALPQADQTATTQALLGTILAELPSATPSERADSPVATAQPTDPAATDTPIETAAPPPDAPGLEPGRVTTEDYNFYNPSIAPGHQSIASAIQVGDSWQIVEIDPVSGLVRKKITDTDRIYSNPHYSDDGQTLLLRAIVNGNSNLYLADAQTGEILQKLTNYPESISYPRWMPDYQSYLYKRYSDADSEVFIGYLDGSPPTQLTDNNRYDGSPASSPDGRLIAMSSFIEGNYEIVILERDTGEFDQLTFDAGRDSEPVFSPDGNWIAFESDRGGDYNIWAIRLDGSDLKRVTFDSQNELIPAFSPGGGWLYFQQRQSDGNFSINRVAWP
jgi:Tol biopolymer transport system component